MGRSNWPPSIVPNENDQTVYLVANDFGKPGRAWAEAEYERTDLEAVIQDPLQANTAIRSVSSLSTQPKAGPKTYQKTYLMNCVGAATCRCATSHFSFMILPIATRADIATHAVAYALGLTMAFQRKKPAAIGIKAPFPGSSNPRSPRPSRKSRAANAGYTRSSSMVTLMCQASSAIFRKRFVQSLPRRVKNFTAALARWTWSRKAHLRKIIDGTDIQYSESFEVEGKEMYAHACKVGLEGVVSKVRDSPYTSGRGNNWVKKTCAQRERLIIAGFAPDGRKWDGLYLARRKGADLIYAGRLVSTKRHTSR